MNIYDIPITNEIKHFGIILNKNIKNRTENNIQSIIGNQEKDFKQLVMESFF